MRDGDSALGDRRTHRAIVAVLYAASLALHAWAARALGVAEGEGARLRAALDAAQLVTAYRTHGISALTRPLLDASLASGKPSPLLPTLLSGGLWQVLADHDGRRLDALTALRLGVVLVSAGIAPLVFVLARRTLGTAAAIAASVFALAVPRGIEQETLLSGDGVLSALLLATVVCHLRSLTGRSWRLGALAGALLGLSLSVSFSALLLLPVLVVSDAIHARASAARLLPRGELPISGAVLWLPISGAMTFLAAQPHLYRDTFERVRELLVAAASPRVVAGLWRGAAPAVEAIPRGHAVTMALASLPSVTAILAVTGFAVVGARFWSARALSTPVSLATALAATFLGWPLVCPPALATFPSHWVVALPYLAILAAYGATSIAEALRARWPAFSLPPFRHGLLVALALPAVVASASPATSSAAFPLLAGGPRRAAHAGTVPLHDGTPLGALAPLLDAAARDGATVFAPEIAADVWEWMARLGRLHVRLRPTTSPEGADLVVLTGDVPPERLRGATLTAVVEREGQPVLTLVRR